MNNQTNDTNDEWQKALVMVMRKLGIVEILIEQKDIDSIINADEDARPCPLLFQQDDGVHVRIVTVGEVRAMQEKEESRIVSPH